MMANRFGRVGAQGPDIVLDSALAEEFMQDEEASGTCYKADEH